MGDMQKDLVLSINEYAFVLDKTKGNVSCWVGPVKTSLSTSDELVRFNETTKSFESCSYENAIHLFATAPENWYIVLKNPVDNNKHPNPGTANSLPEKINVGRKVNIMGPTSFALYPGQMCKVIQGHSLKVNQYLLARVYDADSANNSLPTAFDKDGNPISSEDKYTPGQLIIIKGTDVSFYIPPTGIEVVFEKKTNSYIRNATTLERLEYCILKDENGQKRYEHGPKVVFPEPTETFVESKNKSNIFKAIELSPISGIYIKVIAEYKEINKKGEEVIHPVGEELFITGKEQMIYYPRPEHAIINYDGKFMHHAIAIPKGEGRYIMNRNTGEINTVFGPAMYLPDPRNEVVIKRKLSERECRLWYPGNEEAINYNLALDERSLEKSIQRYNQNALSINSCSIDAASMGFLDANTNISRGTSYTKPRTVTLDTKYDGVVSINVWDSFAVKVTSKDGKSYTVKGPKTVLLEYDETLDDIIFNNVSVVYLPYKDSVINVKTKILSSDKVPAFIEASFRVSFKEEDIDKWFNIKNIVEHFRDKVIPIIKNAFDTININDIYAKSQSILDSVFSNEQNNYFPENGMIINGVRLMELCIDENVQEMFEDNRNELIKNRIELAKAEEDLEINKKLALINQELANISHEKEMLSLQNSFNYESTRLENKKKIADYQAAQAKAEKEAEKDLIPIKQELENFARNISLQRQNDELENEKAKATLKAKSLNAYAESVNKILTAITPELTAALQSSANENIVEALTNALSPYSMAKNESVADTINTLLRGTSLEKILFKEP